MEEEETYLELYLDQCAAQVSWEVVALSPSQGLRPCFIAERQVVRCKGFAFIS